MRAASSDELASLRQRGSLVVRLRGRTVRMEGAPSQGTARLMVFKLVTVAAKTWCRLKGGNQLPEVVQGAMFRDGIEIANAPARNTA